MKRFSSFLLLAVLVAAPLAAQTDAKTNKAADDSKVGATAKPAPSKIIGSSKDVQIPVPAGFARLSDDEKVALRKRCDALRIEILDGRNEARKADDKAAAKNQSADKSKPTEQEKSSELAKSWRTEKAKRDELLLLEKQLLAGLRPVDQANDKR